MGHAGAAPAGRAVPAPLLPGSVARRSGPDPRRQRPRRASTVAVWVLLRSSWSRFRSSTFALKAKCSSHQRVASSAIRAPSSPSALTQSTCAHQPSFPLSWHNGQRKSVPSRFRDRLVPSCTRLHSEQIYRPSGQRTDHDPGRASGPSGSCGHPCCAAAASSPASRGWRRGASCQHVSDQPWPSLG